MNKYWILYALSLLVSCNGASEKKPLSARQIILNAYQAAGGDFWQKPKSLVMKGSGIFYQGDSIYQHEVHNMWRVYDSSKDAAHKANGKVRIESFRKGVPIVFLSFDGEHTYTLKGKQPKSNADNRWASSFGFGVIRHALDVGYAIHRLDDGVVGEDSTYQVKVVDPNQGETVFGIRIEDHAIVKVHFDTPRGLHHRIYSEFFSKKEYTWNQPGRVELYYDNKISNIVIWEDFEVNLVFPDSIFVL